MRLVRNEETYQNEKGLPVVLQQVFVNGKRISADIVSLDTEAGWVDIELPGIPPQYEAGKSEDKLELAVRRLNGEVRVLAQ